MLRPLTSRTPTWHFFKCWSILEKITDTVGSKYDETIQKNCLALLKG